MRHERRTFALLSLALAFAATGVALGGEQSLRVGNDVFLAGDEAAFRSDVTGDALLAGGEVSFEGSTGGDAVLTGGRVRVRGNIGEDLYAAGGEVSVSGTISGSARIAGGKVRIDESAQINDGLSVAGGRVELNGHAGRYAQIAGGEVRIDGRVDGDVDVSSGELVIGPRAVIEGRVTHRGPRAPRVDSSAQVQGGVHHVPSKGDGRALRNLFTFAAFLWLAGWTIVGILILGLLPGASRAVTDTARSRPWAAVLLGLALCFAIPVVIVLCAITLVGIPLALLLLCLYFVLLPLGYLASVATLGDWLLPRLRGGKPVTTPMRIGAFVLVLVVAYLITRIPVVGGLIVLALLLAGLGGLVLAVAQRRQPASA
ncbi:MAG: hypothetical protein ACRETT_08870 [Steroidobacteraceae bacterium]